MAEGVGAVQNVSGFIFSVKAKLWFSDSFSVIRTAAMMQGISRVSYELRHAAIDFVFEISGTGGRPQQQFDAIHLKCEIYFI